MIMPLSNQQMSHDSTSLHKSELDTVPLVTGISNLKILRRYLPMNLSAFPSTPRTSNCHYKINRGVNKLRIKLNQMSCSNS